MNLKFILQICCTYKNNTELERERHGRCIKEENKRKKKQDFNSAE